MSSSLEAVVSLVRTHYGLEVAAKLLPGEVDLNYRLSDQHAQDYIFKITDAGTDLARLEFQHAMLDWLRESDLTLDLPEVVPALNGELVPLIEQSVGRVYCRLLRWVPGRCLRTVHPRTVDLLQQWGALCGQLSRVLQGFDHPAAHYEQAWDPAHGSSSREDRQYLDPERYDLADYWWSYFEQTVREQRKDLRKSINYNDAHEDNLLIDQTPISPKITGLIDLGDAVYGPTVCELAIAAAYAGMDQDDPLGAIALVVGAYHQEFPLVEAELAVLPGLIAARLLKTVTSAAKGRCLAPDNAYLSVHEAPAWRLLAQLKAAGPALCHYHWRTACGWEACPKVVNFKAWVTEASDEFCSPVELREDQVIPLDLGLASTRLGTYQDYVDLPAFERQLRRYLEDEGATAGYGGYLEIRPFYTTDAYQQMGLQGVRWRTMHLGLDIWKKAGTPVRAVYPGTIHTLHDNDQDRDYGPTIILEHEPANGPVFYSLYGHLNKDCLKDLQLGQEVAAGAAIAQFGNSKENGGWPPHLHFQLMLDLLEYKNDFPGVAFPEERDIWASICPDPYFLFPELSPVSASLADSSLLSNSRKKLLGRSLSLSYDQPLTMVRGWGTYLLDQSGRRYLDTVNNVAHVGHEHPWVVAAGQAQMAVLNTNTRYLHPAILEYAEALLATFPPELSVVHFTNSGSEANELALRMLRTCTNRQDVLAMEVGYHGNTQAVLDVSSYKFDGKGGAGAPASTHLLPLPDTFRGRHRDLLTAAEAYAAYAPQLIAHLEEEGRPVAGFIGESILSCGGQIVLPQGYLSRVYSAVRASGGLCVADEVQTGFGRVGDHFWAFELQGVVPDIVVLGKPIGNGHPLAAVVCTPAIAEGFANGMEYFNTFGGNPVSCRVGQAVLQVIEEEGLQQNALETGNYLLKGLRSLQQQYPIIGDVRGHGLFLGFELVRRPEEKVPHPEAAHYLANWMRRRGILMSTDGPDHNVIKIKPPLVFGRFQADFLLEELSNAFKHDFLQV
ncbi:MAG: aminotransferase class III-fold pyridoxal phosphate-dependent enzyme [Bacteroidota bacterium]